MGAAPRFGLHLVAAWTVAVFALTGAPGAGAQVQDPPVGPTTTAPSSTTSSTTSTTSPSPSPSTTEPAASTSSSSTTSTSVRGPTFNGEPLPPASVASLPPEDELPPLEPSLIPPAPPPGADESGRRRALGELRAAEGALKKARALEAQLRRRLDPLAVRRSTARATLAGLDGESQRLATGLLDARAKVKKIAVAGYIHGGDSQPVDYLLRSRDPLDFERRRIIVRSATEARNAAVIQYSAAQRQTSDELRLAVLTAEEAESAFVVVDTELSSASFVAGALAFAVEEKRQLLDHTAASATVGDTDIPRLFYDAYKQAATKLAARAPQCRVNWTAIAAIGKVESNHGRYRGAQFALNGDVFPRILGIPLDGTRSALILDSDQGVLDTDLVFDRAVGPMQFIPSTWIRINTDGNGDGVSDPNNAYDAALGTATYLCRAVPAGGLDTDEGLRPAFFSYNHSDAYVEKVLGWAHVYAGTPPPLPATPPTTTPSVRP